MASRFGFDIMLKKMEAMKRDLPPVIGNMGLRFFVDAFSKQGWTDKSFSPWEPKKDKKNTLPILVGKSGGTKKGAHTHLRKAVNNSLVRSVWNEILFDVKGVPYARIHNEGGVIHKDKHRRAIEFKVKKNGQYRFAKKGKGNLSRHTEFGAHAFKMPKRQYIGFSFTLMTKIRESVDKEMIKILGRR